MGKQKKKGRDEKKTVGCCLLERRGPRHLLFGGLRVEGCEANADWVGARGDCSVDLETRNREHGSGGGASCHDPGTRVVGRSVRAHQNQS